MVISLESEKRFISSQILGIFDGNEIWDQIFSGSRTGHTCAVRLVDSHPSTKLCSEISRGLKVRWWPQQLEDVLPGELRQFIRAEDAHAMKDERGLGK